MKSKVQDAKDDQGYNKNPMQCNNCSHYKSDFVDRPAGHWDQHHKVEKNKRCGIGGFAVQSSSSCRLYKAW